MERVAAAEAMAPLFWSDRGRLSACTQAVDPPRRIALQWPRRPRPLQNSLTWQPEDGTPAKRAGWSSPRRERVPDASEPQIPEIPRVAGSEFGYAVVP